MSRSLKFRLLFLAIMSFVLAANAQTPDTTFHIYLCFGQSNMEGQGTIESQDLTVDSRLRVMGALTCTGTKSYNLGEWTTAVPPIFRCNTNLGPADYFGREMISNMPANYRIGIVPVAIGGCDIALFDKVNYATYVSTAPVWMQSAISAYGGNPYGRLVDIAKEAQKSGVIKGILMHQGETNTGQSTWPAKVKEVYDNLIADLSLDPAKTPLLVGEVLAAPNACCASHNSVIATIPNVIPNSYVISSSGLDGMADNAHFTSAAYRTLGIRYATQMLALQPPPATDYTSATATPNSVFNDVANTVTFSVTAKPNITSVKIDLSSIGGAADAEMTSQGNNEFSITHTIPAGASTGSKYIHILLSDNANNTSPGAIALSISPTVSYLNIYTDNEALFCGACTWAGNGTLTEESNNGANEGIKDFYFTYTLADWWAGIGLNVSNWSNAQFKNFSSYDSIEISYQGAVGAGTQVLISLKDSFGVNAPNVILPVSATYTTAKIPLSSFTGIDLRYIVEFNLSIGGVQTGSGSIRFDKIRLIKENKLTSVLEPGVSSKAIVVYPNPSDGRFNILMDKMSEPVKRVEVLNAMGASIYATDAIQDNSVAVSDVGAGVYYVRVYFSSGRSEVAKVVVK